MAINIQVGNNKCRILGSRKTAHRLHELIKIKAKGYFWSPAWRSRQWDGWVRYVTENGMFSTGLLPEVVGVLKKWKKKVVIEDKRGSFKDLHEVTELGGKEFRSYQSEALHATLSGEFMGMKWVRGILHEATNAGKNLIAAGIFSSFSNKRRGLFLIDNSEIYEQAIRELEELLPGQIGQIQGKTIKWNRITIAMVQSLSNLVKKDPKAKAELLKQSIVIVDEADMVINKKQGKTVVNYCYNAPIRIALSGTPLVHKDPNKNKNVLAFFGPIIHKISNKELVDQGYSAVPNIKMKLGNTKHRYPGDYKKEYEKGITRSLERNRAVWKTISFAIRKERLPALILIKFHEHIDYLLEHCPKSIRGVFTIRSVHHETGGRSKIFKDFGEGKIPILISSMIIKRGKNLPLMRTLTNAAGGDSEANALQILGRGLRKFEGKKEKIDYNDFWDEGKYLKRHSKHRLFWYKKEGFTVKELYLNNK